MKFQRNARIVRSQMDVTPFAGVFFCLLIFVLLGSLVYTPGVRITLPDAAGNTPGTAGPVIAVGLDPSGQYYYQNQIIPEASLVGQLKAEVRRQKSQRQEDLTLVVQADKAVSLEQLNHLWDIATSAGIKNMAQQVRPRAFDTPGRSPNLPNP